MSYLPQNSASWRHLWVLTLLKRVLSGGIVSRWQRDIHNRDDITTVIVLKSIQLGPVVDGEDSVTNRMCSLSSRAPSLGYFDSKEFAVPLSVHSSLQQPGLIAISIPSFHQWMQIWLRIRHHTFYSFLTLWAQILYNMVHVCFSFYIFVHISVVFSLLS